MSYQAIHALQGVMWLFLMWLNYSAIKRRNLIGSFSSPNFAIRTAKMDRAHIDFGELLFQFIHKINSFLSSRNLFTFIFGGQIQLHVHKRDVRIVNKWHVSFRVLVYREWVVETYQFTSRHFIELASLLRIGEILLSSFFSFFPGLWNSPAARSVNLRRKELYKDFSNSDFTQVQ